MVRKDGEPLSKEVVKTMYEFHGYLLSDGYFEEKMCGNTPYEITPNVFQDFLDREQVEGLKDGKDGCASGDQSAGLPILNTLSRLWGDWFH